jgi:hypothetical protein
VLLSDSTKPAFCVSISRDRYCVGHSIGVVNDACPQQCRFDNSRLCQLFLLIAQHVFWLGGAALKFD